MTVYARPRDVVRVSGSDAVSFLQGQLSQDVEGLAMGSSTFSFLLQPQGKVDAWLRVTRRADEVLLDVDAGWGEAVITRLNRFKLRTKADLELLPGWTAAAGRDGTSPQGGLIVEAEAWWAGVDALGEGVLGEPGWDDARIRHGIPAMGAELDEKTIPGETGLVDLSVSFTKGCYTGQELVARIDSRGHVNRHLRRLALGGPAEVGASIVSGEGKDVGSVTSVSGDAALGYVRREVEPGAIVTVGATSATVLPLW